MNNQKPSLKQSGFCCFKMDFIALKEHVFQSKSQPINWHYSSSVIIALNFMYCALSLSSKNKSEIDSIKNIEIFMTV